jgi:DNA-damage-inducible protein D
MIFMNKETAIILFKDQPIRRTWYNEEWWFSIIDVVGILSKTANSLRYWSDLKRRLIETEGFLELYEKIVQLKIEASDGKMRETDCANTETLFRIIHSIPSPKVEPFIGKNHGYLAHAVLLFFNEYNLNDTFWFR